VRLAAAAEGGGGKLYILVSIILLNNYKLTQARLRSAADAGGGG